MASTHPAPVSTAHETKLTRLSLQEVAENGTFEGYASLFNREDLGRDVVLPGAFRETLAGRGAKGVRMLFQHDPNQPIGIWLKLHEDARGLFARGQISTDVAKGREVLALMRSGAIDGLSIGFRTVKAKRDNRSGVRRLSAIDLWEISVVTFPMLPEARVQSVKGKAPFAGRLPTHREFERWLVQNAGFSLPQARALTRSGIKGLSAQAVGHAAPRAAFDEMRLLAQVAEAARLLRQP